MKRFVCLLLAAALLASLFAGCKRDTVEPVETSSMAEEKEPAGPYKIGLVQCGEYAPLDVMREAFMSRLDEWGYDEARVAVDYQNAGADSKKAGEICKQFTRDGVDMIVAVGAPAAKVAVDAVGSSGIKVVFVGVNNPKADLGIKNLSAPERGITGASDRVAGEQSVEFARKVVPHLQSIGLLYDPEDANASAAAKAVQDYCGKAGIDTYVDTATNADSVQKAAEELCAQADILFTPGDSVVAAAAGKLAEVSSQAKKPWLAGTDQMVQNGAVGCVCADYSEVGNKAADMAVKIMTGTSVSQVPVYFFDAWQTWLNPEAIASQELELPEEVLSGANYVKKP